MYELTSREEQGGEVTGTYGVWRVWVTGEHRAAGGAVWDVLGQKQLWYWHGPRPVKLEPGEALRGMVVGTIGPDGQFDGPTKMVERVDPAEVFPRLPADEKQAAGGYTYPTSYGDTMRVAVTERGAQAWKLTLTNEGPMAESYEVHNTQTATIDLRQGLPTGAEGTRTEGWIKSKSTMTVTLKENLQHDAKWAEAAAKDAHVVSMAWAKYREELEAARAAPAADIEKHVKAARASVDDASALATTPEVREYLKNLAEGAGAEMVRNMQDAAARRAQVMDKPAAEWELDKVGGGKLALKDLRGKVAVLDFWYRGCGWCIRAMPQVKQLAEDYKDRGVVVLGMNTDSDERDAKAVTDRMGLNYATVRAGHELAEKYGVQGFPTLVIVDQAGVVRGMHMGYSANLRKQVGEKLEELLRK
jgi:thiol-disulfide isomerase/thioredoxin